MKKHRITKRTSLCKEASSTQSIAPIDQPFLHEYYYTKEQRFPNVTIRIEENEFLQASFTKTHRFTKASCSVSIFSQTASCRKSIVLRKNIVSKKHLFTKKHRFTKTSFHGKTSFHKKHRFMKKHRFAKASFQKKTSFL